MAETAIKLSNVGIELDHNEVLKGINLEVEAGQSMVLIGPSGCGKTVLLKTVIGVYSLSYGKIIIGKQSVVGISNKVRADINRRFGMLFQKSGLFGSMTVWENICFRLIMEQHMSRSRARELAIEKLALVGLDAREADLYPTDLSGGMQKRVGIARAIATDPDILLLDEPTAGLDPISSNMINDMILNIVAELGVTVLSVNSDMSGAAKIAEKAAMIYNGKIIWQGSTKNMQEVQEPHVNQFVNCRSDGPIPTIVGL